MNIEILFSIVSSSWWAWAILFGAAVLSYITENCPGAWDALCGAATKILHLDINTDIED